jgi:hypothetical protein
MKISKFLLIIGITALLLVFAVNTSFAVSSEKTTKYKQYQWESCNKKFVSINHFEVSDENGNSKSSYKISIKKYYKNKYKIKSVNLKYVDWGDTESSNYLHMNYTIKNKNSLTIKDPKKNLYLQKVTVNYHTKNKIKKESFSFTPSGKWKRTAHYFGITFKGTLKQKGHIIKEYGCMEVLVMAMLQYLINLKPLQKIKNIKSTKLNYSLLVVMLTLSVELKLIKHMEKIA